VLFDAGQAVGAGAFAEHHAALPRPTLWERDRRSAENDSSADLFAQILEQRGVAVHARPDVPAPMSSLPTTAVGKVDKKAVIALLNPAC